MNKKCYPIGHMQAISPHLRSDLLAYAAFLAGQLMFLLKRAGSAVRNPGTTIKTRWQFFNQNWDTFGIRAAIEFPFFYGFRHYSLGQFVAFFGWSAPTWLLLPDNPLPCFFLGFAADSLLDWAALSPKLPAFLRSWIGENVPKFDVAVKLQETLDTAQAASAEAGAQVAKAVEAISTAQEQVPAIVSEVKK